MELETKASRTATGMGMFSDCSMHYHATHDIAKKWFISHSVTSDWSPNYKGRLSCATCLGVEWYQKFRMVCETLCQSSNNYKNKTESTHMYVYYISTESAYLPLILLNFSMVKVRQPHPRKLKIINSGPWTKSQSIISYSKKRGFQVLFKHNKLSQLLSPVFRTPTTLVQGCWTPFQRRTRLNMEYAEHSVLRNEDHVHCS